MLNGNLDSDTEFIKSVKKKAALEVHDAISGLAQVEVSATVSTEAIMAREATIEAEAADGSTVQVLHQIPEEGESLRRSSRPMANGDGVRRQAQLHHLRGQRPRTSSGAAHG